MSCKVECENDASYDDQIYTNSIQQDQSSDVSVIHSLNHNYIHQINIKTTKGRHSSQNICDSSLVHASSQPADNSKTFFSDVSKSSSILTTTGESSCIKSAELDEVIQERWNSSSLSANTNVIENNKNSPLGEFESNDVIMFYQNLSLPNEPTRVKKDRENKFDVASSPDTKDIVEKSEDGLSEECKSMVTGNEIVADDNLKELNKCSLNKDKPYVCTICGKSISQKGSFNIHMRIHTGEKPYICPECGKGFSCKGALNAHMAVHTGLRPFACTQCDKAFTNKSCLKLHEQLHSGDAAFKCEICDKAYVTSTRLKIHMRIHAEKHPFQCPDCGKGYTHKASLQKHLKGPPKEKAFKCTICDKSFRQSGTLTSHLHRHRGIRPHKCTVCEKSFTQKGSLNVHMRVHTGERPYKCSFCPKSFRQSGALTTHLSTHTGT